MDNTKCRITVTDSIHLYTDREYVIYLIQSLVLVLHLLIYTKEMLYSSIDLSLKTGIVDVFLDILNHPLDVRISLRQLLINLCLEVIVHLRHEVHH